MRKTKKDERELLEDELETVSAYHAELRSRLATLCQDDSRSRITIRTLTGKTTSVIVYSADTIQNVKKSIEEKLDYPSEQQHLIFAGKALDNHRTLDEYHIKDGDMLHLVLKHRC